MAAPKSGSRGHPGKALSLIALIIAVLYGVMFITGDKTPRLGIDLAGGTEVTLKAKPDQGGSSNAINSDNMNTAVNIIRQRVNAFGVSEAEVQKQGSDTIVIDIPKGKNEQSAAEQVGQTARLYFRPVLEAATYTPTSASPSASPQPSGSTSPAPSPSATSSGQAAAAPTPSATGSSSVKPTSTGSAKPSTNASHAAYLTDGTSGTGGQSHGGIVQAGYVQDNTPAPATSPPAQIDLTAPTPAASPTQAPGAATTDTPSPTDTSSSTGQVAGVPADLQAKYDSLDCSDPANRNGNTGPADQPTVACSQSQTPGQAEKYILGPVAVDGTNISSAQAELPSGTQFGGWEVALNFDGTGTSKFADITGKLASGAYPTNRFAIELDGLVVSAPTVSASIPGGQAVITGSFSQSSAKNLADVLKYGALPLTFQTQDITKVSASLGGDQLRGGLIAGAIGMLLVILYSLMYYRGLGLVSIASLVVSAALTYSIMSLLGRGIGFALNLPAVCGAIVAIGITADSFIVYFERIRDEIREGRTLRPAVQKAWPRARRTILVSDFVSFLAAAVLYWVSIGKVKGFAFTLGLTTLLDVVVVFLFTKPLMVILAERKFFASGHPWSGLDPKRLGAKKTVSYRGRRTRPASRTTADASAKEA